MKKFLTVLIATVLLLPVFAKADVAVIKPYYNSKVIVDGEVEFNIPVQYDLDYNMEVTYDSSMFKTSKDMITVSEKSSSDKFDVTVESGKIKIVSTIKTPTGVVDPSSPYFTIKFTALKAGNGEITFGGQIMGPITSKVTVEDKNCPATSEEKEETTEPSEKEEEKKEDAKEEAKPAKEEKRDKDLILYISLGLNALLLIALIAVALKKKKKAEPAVEAAPVETLDTTPSVPETPVEETPVESTPEEPKDEQ